MSADARLGEALIGPSALMDALRHDIRALAATPTTVLISGETGTGKSQVARLLHLLSPRKAEPFVRVDCAALPGSLIEAELFGHEPGAFTGAVRARRGRAERAAGGTLFFDEIGELAPGLQAKLLSLIEERSFERLGGEKPIPLRARILAATHVDLDRAVAEGRFRADLYFRLAVAAIRVPALRERPEDVGPIARHLARRIAARTGCGVPSLDAGWLAALERRKWPGNVRELANVIERWMVLGEMAAPPPVATAAGPAPAAHEAAPSEERIRHALRDARGNVAAAARRLGLPRTTLRRRIARLDASAEPRRGPEAGG